MSNIQELFGKKLRHIRQAKGMTQEALAELSNLSIQFIGEIERGKRNPSLTSIQNLASALDEPVPSFFDLEEFRLSTEDIRAKLLQQIENADNEELHLLYAVSNIILK